MAIKHIIPLFFAIALLNACELESDDKSNIRDHFYVESDKAFLPITLEGNLESGRVLIVLHGGPGGDASIYNYYNYTVSDTIESEMAVCYYDQRSSGVSSGAFGRLEYLHIAQHVRDLERVILALRHRYGADLEIFLMGHSWGGTLGTAFLLEPGNQELVNAWIEVDGAHNFSAVNELLRAFELVGNEMLQSGNSVEFWQEVVDFVADIDANSINGSEISQLNSYGFEAETYLSQDGFLSGNADTDLLRYSWFSKHNSLTASSNLFMTSSGFGMFVEVVETDYTDQLDEISIPCLFLWGRYDLVVPVELGQQAYNRVSTPPADKALVIFESSGHSPMLNQPDAYAKVLLDYIKER